MKHSTAIATVSVRSHYELSRCRAVVQSRIRLTAAGNRAVSFFVLATHAAMLEDVRHNRSGVHRSYDVAAAQEHERIAANWETVCLFFRMLLPCSPWRCRFSSGRRLRLSDCGAAFRCGTKGWRGAHGGPIDQRWSWRGGNEPRIASAGMKGEDRERGVRVRHRNNPMDCKYKIHMTLPPGHVGTSGSSRVGSLFRGRDDGGIKGLLGFVRRTTSAPQLPMNEQSKRC